VVSYKFTSILDVLLGTIITVMNKQKSRLRQEYQGNMATGSTCNKGKSHPLLKSSCKEGKPQLMVTPK
jgi:hypothetical protein